MFFEVAEEGVDEEFDEGRARDAGFEGYGVQAGDDFIGQPNRDCVTLRHWEWYTKQFSQFQFYFVDYVYHWYTITHVSEKSNPRTRPVPIRLDERTRERLEKAARRLTSTRAGVIRLAIVQFLPDVEAGQINLKH